MPLAPADRSKLAAVLNRLDSPHAGEVAAAAAAATRLVRGKGLDWAEVLNAGTTSTAAVQTPGYPTPTDHWADLKVCADHLSMLTRWERDYVTSLWYVPRPSAKQKRILADIVVKIRAAGPRAG